MPIEVACQNPLCGVVLTLKDDLAGKKIRCPRCGAAVDVPKQRVAAPAPGPKATAPASGPIHPAARKCPVCGAIVGPAHKFCPKCGADIRTGLVAETKAAQKKRLSLKPVLIPVIALVVVGALAAGIWAVLRTRGGGEPKGAAAPAAVPGGGVQGAIKAPQFAGPAAPVQPPAPEPDKSAEVAPLPPDPEIENLKGVVTAYVGQLQQIAAARESSSSEDMAARWARLYRSCCEGGLQAEAQMCWLSAVLLEPRDAETNTILGRTANFRGLPVTPAQGEYLTTRMGKLEVVNRCSRLADLSVGLEGGPMHALPPSQSLGLDVGTEAATLVLRIGADGGEGGAQFTVKVPEGAGQKITLLADSLVPVVVLGDFSGLKFGLDMWKRDRGSANPPPAAALTQYGWTQTKGGWNLAVQNKQPVRFRTDEAGNLSSVTRGSATLSSVEDKGLMVSVSGQTCTVHGKLGGLALQDQWVTLIGTEERPIRLEAAESGTARVREGRIESQGEVRDVFAAKFEGRHGLELTYVVEQGEGAPAREVFGVLSPILAEQSSEARLERRRQELQARLNDLETRGELPGGWQSEAWWDEHMQRLTEDDEEHSRWLEQAREMPLYADRVSEQGIKDRPSYVYLEWPLFREALVAAVGKEAARSREVESTELPSGLLGVPGRPQRQGEGPVAGSVAQSVLEEERRQREAEGEVGPGEQTPVQPTAAPEEPEEPPVSTVSVELLPLMPDAAAVAFLSAGWDRIEAMDRITAIRGLRCMRSLPVVELLRGLVGASPESLVKAEAMFVLGEIGTPKALEGCRATVLDRTVQGASLAALAACCDPSTIQMLPDTLRDALPDVKGAFLSYLLQAESPTMIIGLSRALESYGDTTSRLKIAEHLGAVGGHAAMAVLARLMQEQNDAYVAVTGKVRPAEMMLLIEPLSKMLEGDAVRSKQVAFLLARSRLPAAVPALKAAAVDRRLPHAAVALAALGSAEALEAAAQVKDLIRPADLNTIRGYWRDAAAGQQWAWNPEVDGGAAVSFLQTLLREGNDKDVRVAAANLMRETGERPDAQGLVMIAALPVAAEAVASTTSSAPPYVNTQIREDEEEIGPMDVRYRGGVGKAVPSVAEQQAKAAEAMRKLESKLAGTPQIRALNLLEEQTDPASAPELRELAETASSAEIKAQVLKLLGRVADEESLQFLRAKAGRSQVKFADTAAMVNDSWVRAGAAVGLAAAGDPQVGDVLHDLISGPAPSPSESFETQPEEAEFAVAAKMRQSILLQGVREAMTALRGRQTLWDVSKGSEQTALVVEDLTRIAKENLRSMGASPEADIATATAIACLGRAGHLSESSRELLNIFSANPGQLPVVVRQALLDALWQIGDATAREQLTRLLPYVANDRALAEHWVQLCIQAAAVGGQPEYDYIRDSLGMMDKPAIRELVAMMSLRQDSQPSAYYKILGRAAASQALSEGRPGVQQTAAETGEDIEFRWRCLMLLSSGPDAVVSQVLEDKAIGLLDDNLFGPQVALMLKTRSPGFDAVGYLKEWFAAHKGPSERCEVIAVAQKLGSREMEQMLGEMFLDRNASEAAPAAAAADAARLTRDPIQSAARALGSLGSSGELQKAFAYTNSSGARGFTYPVAVRKAALEGMAYLPSEKGPVPTLLRFNALLSGPEMKKAGEEALLDAFRLQTERQGE